MRVPASFAVFAAAMALGCQVHVNVIQVGNESPCTALAPPVDTSRPNVLVGDGTPSSCSEDALNTAIEGGGIIRFRCGASPIVIPIATEKVILRDTVIDGGNTITLDGSGASRLFVLGTPGGPTVSLTLQYLTLRRGYAAVTPASAGAPSNAGGGAVLQFGGSLVVTDSVLDENDATATGPDESGGAICALGGRVVIARSSLSDNRASAGGAVAVIGADLTLARSQLTGNRAVGLGSGAQGIGGALLASQQGQGVSICQVTMSGNQAVTFGTAMHLQGVAGEPMTIEQAAFLDNSSSGSTSAASGPAVFLGIVSARLSSVTVADNQGDGNPGIWVNGGTQAAQAATIDFTNVTIARNRVYTHADPKADGVGAALWIEGVVHGELTNCTLASNLSEFGAGIVHPGQLVIRNTIIANQGTNVGVAYNCQNCIDLGIPTVPGTGDHVLQWPAEPIESYPCVTGATIGDPMLGPLQDNGGFAPTMMPQPGSPAIGGGVDCPATDQRGHARLANCTIGAVEADGTGTASP